MYVCACVGGCGLWLGGGVGGCMSKKFPSQEMKIRLF